MLFSSNFNIPKERAAAPSGGSSFWSLAFSRFLSRYCTKNDLLFVGVAQSSCGRLYKLLKMHYNIKRVYVKTAIFGQGGYYDKASFGRS